MNPKINAIIKELERCYPYSSWEFADECEFWNEMAELFQRLLEADDYAWKSDSWQEGMDYFPCNELPFTSSEVPADYAEDMERAFENAVFAHQEEQEEEEEEDWEAMDYESEYE